MSDVPEQQAAKAQCSNCAFVVQASGGKFTCHRYPPASSWLMPGGGGSWPLVDNQDWCGEWDGTWVQPVALPAQQSTPQQATFVVTKQTG